MEANDVLSDQMQICRPVFFIEVGGISVRIITDTGDIVGQCVQPYIHDMLVIKINRNSPLEGRSGNTQILKSRKQEVVHHLILAGLRLNKIRMRVDIVNQFRCVLAHFKEVRFLAGTGYRAAAVRAFSVHKL